MQILITIATNGARLVLCSEQQGDPVNAMETACAAIMHESLQQTITKIGQAMQLMQVGQTVTAHGKDAVQMRDETLNGPPVPPVPRPDPTQN